jgi:hypothetical protein
MDDDILFSEKQYFRQVWLWIILPGINVLFIVGIVKQVILGHHFGNKHISDTGLVITTIFTLLLSFLFLNLRLETNIKKDGIYVRFFPFQPAFKYYPWNILTQSFVRQYNPIAEFGGWGFRGLGNNRALNVSGNKGIQLVKQDGSKLLIGTNKASEVTEILKQLGHLTT